MLLIFWFTIIHLINLHNGLENCSINNKTLICYQHLPNIGLNEFTTIQLNNASWDIIDINVIIDKYPKIVNISIIGGNITKFIGPANRNNSIKMLELKNIGVENVGSTFLGHFPNLEILNLQGNYIQSLDNNFNTANLKKLYLGENPWNCSMDLTWFHNLLHKNIVQDKNNLICYENDLHSGKPLEIITEFTMNVKNQCSICLCSLPKVVRNPNTNLYEPIIEVNCTSRNLRELPTKLPENTKILHLENNFLTNLHELKANPIYRNLLDLYLDNNQIININELEGTHWLRNFRVFSLNNNKLTELPTYAFDNALEQNPNMPNAVRIFLSGNPWRCDCAFTPVFQEMMQKFSAQIKDANLVKCSYVEGDENSLLPIIQLSRSSVCRLSTEYSIQALDLLNGILATLIVLVLGKLAYDYYYFKKTGKLPWIVTKMP